MYYVGFSTSTIIASLILFQGFNTTNATNTVSLLCGFIVTFFGVHLLNISRTPEPPLDHSRHSALEGGLMNPRMSLQGRMSLDGWNGAGAGAGDVAAGGRHGRQSSLYRSQTTTLFNAFEEHDPVANRTQGSEAVGLQLLREEDETDDDMDMDMDMDERTHLRKKKRQQQQRGGGVNGSARTPLPNRTSGSRSHTPVSDASLSDVRISPRP